MKIKILIASICVLLFTSCTEDQSNSSTLVIPETQQEQAQISTEVETEIAQESEPQEIKTEDITEEERQIIESLFGE